MSTAEIIQFKKAVKRLKAGELIRSEAIPAKPVSSGVYEGCATPQELFDTVCKKLGDTAEDGYFKKFVTAFFIAPLIRPDPEIPNAKWCIVEPLIVEEDESVCRTWTIIPNGFTHAHTISYTGYVVCAKNSVNMHAVV